MRIRRIDERGKGEQGFVLATTALLFITLLCFAGFSVDIGAWYARGNELQRVADAASLAGVVWMPDLTKATQVALDTAAKNGVTPSTTVSVTVSPVTGNAHQLKVTITDTKAKQYFSQLVVRGKTITRTATAEYFLPVPLGSPTNYFGTGSLNSGTPPKENVWAAVSGYCAAKENGDLRLAGFDNAYSGSGYDCNTTNGAIVNPDYQSSGYLFAMDVPSGYSGSLAVQVYDAGFQSGSSPNPDSSLVSGATVTTTYTLLDKGPAFSDPLSHSTLSTVTVSSNNTAYQGWQTLFNFTPVAGNTYYVEVKTLANETHSEGSNGFGIRAANGGTFSACSADTTITNPAYSASCVQLHGYSDLSMFANLSGTTATFYLAQVGAQYAGKTMTIRLFDVGEGASKVEILDPGMDPVTTVTGVSFDWTTACPPGTLPSCSGTGVTSLNPSPQSTTYRPYPRLSSQYIYNDRSLVITVQLPGDFSVYSGKTWWKIRYTVATSPTDRTTWSVDISGSPVHLVN
jgi:hypothetical protein